MGLADTLTDQSKKSAVIADCMQLLEQEVADKSGLSGVAIKAGYKAVKGIRPGFIENVVTDLLPEFANAVEPLVDEATEKGESTQAYLTQNKSRVADSLLAITDGKAERSTNKLIKKTYGKLRKIAKSNVEAAVPRLGGLIERHTA